MYPIRIIKMTTGEVLIAGIADTTTGDGKEGVYTFEDPMLIVQIPTKQKDSLVMETMVFMKPCIEFSNDMMFIVPKDKVVCISVPDQGILFDYEDAKKNLFMTDMDEKMGGKGKKGKSPEGGDQNDDPDDEPPENFNEGEADDIGPF